MAGVLFEAQEHRARVGLEEHELAGGRATQVDAGEREAEGAGDVAAALRGGGEDKPMTTLAVGEEGGDDHKVTTLALGEEGG